MIQFYDTVIIMLSRYALLTLLLIVAVTYSKKCTKHVPYTQASLTLTWPGQFCWENPNNDYENSKCTLDYQRNWDGLSFTIHGYWPSYNSKDLSCVKMGGRPDPYCDYDYLFNQKALDKVQNLNTVWPMWGSRMGDSFHEYEWNKHGVCYMKLTKDEFGTRFSEDYIFSTYFEQAIAKAILHRTVTKHRFESKEDLANEIKVQDVSHFYLSCQSHKGTTFVNELRICYDINQPGKEEETHCFLKDLQQEDQQCEYPIFLAKKEGSQDQTENDDNNDEN